MYVFKHSEYTAYTKQLAGTFDLRIFKGNEPIYNHPNLIYSLKDVATILRIHLNTKGLRVKWESADET